jgi:hypothetical protein
VKSTPLFYQRFIFSSLENHRVFFLESENHWFFLSRLRGINSSGPAISQPQGTQKARRRKKGETEEKWTFVFFPFPSGPSSWKGKKTFICSENRFFCLLVA